MGNLLKPLHRAWILDRFFHWLYHEGAWAYDGIAALVSAGRWVRWVESVLGDLEGERALELGPGPGYLLAAMARAGFRPVGLERSATMGRRARRRAGAQVPLVQGRAERLPFRAGSFDTVVTTFPAPFILEPDTWREAARVLRPGGRFVVLLGAWPAGRGPGWGVFRLLYRWAARSNGEALRQRLRSLAGEAGMALREWSRWDGPWRLDGVLAVREDPWDP